MQIHLSPEIEAKLNRVADARGGNAEELAREAIEQFLSYDEWFLSEVEKGLEQIENGQTLSHAEVGARLENRIATKKQPA
jgi:predicted transcriptional regulator